MPQDYHSRSPRVEPQRRALLWVCWRPSSRPVGYNHTASLDHRTEPSSVTGKRTRGESGRGGGGGGNETHPPELRIVFRDCRSTARRRSAAPRLRALPATACSRLFPAAAPTLSRGRAGKPGVGVAEMPVV